MLPGCYQLPSRGPVKCEPEKSVGRSVFKNELMRATIDPQDRRLVINVRQSAAGIHLYDRETGLNVLLDELKSPKEVWARAPRYVSIALTNACDLACAFCYAPKRASRLPFERVVGLVQELAREGCLGVGFGGGEPTLYPRFVELCQITSRTTPLAVSFTTHAHHLNEAMAAGLVGNVSFIRVSVDGLGETYQRLRGRSFARLRKQIRLVRSVASFGINVVVNRDTVGQLDELADFAVSRFSKRSLIASAVLTFWSTMRR